MLYWNAATTVRTRVAGDRDVSLSKNVLGYALIGPFLYFDHFHIFDLFCTSTHRLSTHRPKLYFDLNLTSTFLTKLYFDLNFTLTSLLRQKLYFDLCFSTNKKSRFNKSSKYRGRRKRVEVQRSK